MNREFEQRLSDNAQILADLKAQGWDLIPMRAKEWDRILNEELNEEQESRSYEIECPKCHLEHLIYAKIEPGFADHETVVCHQCKKSIQSIRADWGYELIGTRQK